MFQTTHQKLALKISRKSRRGKGSVNYHESNYKWPKWPHKFTLPHLKHLAS